MKGIRIEDTKIIEILYIEYGIASDQLRRVPEVLEALHSAFLMATGLDATKGDLIRYITDRRKQKNWPKLGGKAMRLESPLLNLTSSDLRVLTTIYLGLRIPLDEYLYVDEYAKNMQEQFQELSGRPINCWKLVAAMMYLRKRGGWVKLTDPIPPAAKPSDDTDQVA